MSRAPGVRGERGVEPERAQVGREVELPAGREQAPHRRHQLRVVALDVEHAGHRLRRRERRRIEHDEVVAPALLVRDVEPAHDVGTDQLMPCASRRRCREIARRPVEIGVRQVDRLRSECATGGGVDGEAAGVREQVQHPPSLRTLADDRAQRAMIEKEPGVEIRFQVHDEAQSRLDDRELASRARRSARAASLPRRLRRAFDDDRRLGQLAAPAPSPRARRRRMRRAPRRFAPSPSRFPAGARACRARDPRRRSSRSRTEIPAGRDRRRDRRRSRGAAPSGDDASRSWRGGWRTR